MRFSVFHFLFRCFSVAGFPVHPYVPNRASVVPAKKYLSSTLARLASRTSVAHEPCKCLF